jgi:hypothetical protein
MFWLNLILLKNLVLALNYVFLTISKKKVLIMKNLKVFRNPDSELSIENSNQISGGWHRPPRDFKYENYKRPRLNVKLNPWQVTGLTDGEGSFICSILNTGKAAEPLTGKREKLEYKIKKKMKNNKSIIGARPEPGVASHPLNRDFTKARIDEVLNPNWVTGFIDGEGSFIIAILPSTGPTKKKVSLRISVTQKSHSSGVLYELQNFFKCGQVIASSKDCMRFVVQSKEDIINKIIPHFTNYPLITSKELNFESLREASEIVRKGEHLSLEGLNKIWLARDIKNRMNRKRSFEELFNHFRRSP